MGFWGVVDVRTMTTGNWNFFLVYYSRRGADTVRLSDNGKAGCLGWKVNGIAAPQVKCTVKVMIGKQKEISQLTYLIKLHRII